MRLKILSLLFIICFSFSTQGQTPKSYTSSEILQQLKKLNVLGSVLYIAAHPDDENTRLLAYMANEKLYRTGYLSLTRGDGGQNLIGDEQGVDLGLIRTQELLAARRVDGAEQFFTRAFDFGFSKSPEEALRIWGHDKILSDVVWVIRKFKPDVIIARFPTTGEGGHGHHTASAILAEEAFDAAADKTKFPEQLQYVSTWQAKRLLWNTFSFGNNNTQRDDQFKFDVGMYNPLLGKSYGEIAAASRSQHKSQGFGVPAQRGTTLEYFKTLKGTAPATDLFDDVLLSWNRIDAGMPADKPSDYFKEKIAAIIKAFNPQQPQDILPQLVALYSDITAIKDEYWRNKKLNEVKALIEMCSGLFMEATTNTQYAVQGDSLKVTLAVNNRTGSNIINADVQIDTTYIIFDQLKKNTNAVKTYSWMIAPNATLSQPYWLEKEMSAGSFNVANQQLIGMAESEPLSVTFSMMIEGKEFTFTKPVRYKFTDPVKGEIYQPVSIVPLLDVKFDKDIYSIKSQGNSFANLVVESKRPDSSNFSFLVRKMVNDNSNGSKFLKRGTANVNLEPLKLAAKNNIPLSFSAMQEFAELERLTVNATKLAKPNYELPAFHLRTINYDHIPSISYLKAPVAKVLKFEIKTLGSLAGYIPGAGDKIPEALEQIGYKVVTLKESDITAENLKQFDVIITGVRAYNTNEWMNNVYDALMQYVKEGGVLFTQYNTSNQLGTVKAKIAPYPFNISRNRITDETAAVNFLLPGHPAVNYPNKITPADFEGWVQERSIYHAETTDTSYKKIFSMNDPGEKEHDGSLIIAGYGSGRFVYTGIVFFRELPAGVPGAYRLFANLIANKRMAAQAPAVKLPANKKVNMPSKLIGAGKRN
jgi:LmbE family N-acetylglucosaminyl deacetylase